MGVGGVVLGGILGAGLGGPVGALIGATLGGIVSGGEEQHRGSGINKGDPDYALCFGAIFAIAGKLAKADGVVSTDEVNIVDRYISDVLDLGKQERQLAIALFNEAKDNNVSVADYIEQFARLKESHTFRASLSFLVLLSIADGELSQSEIAILLKAERAFRLPSGFIDSKLNQYGWLGNHTAGDSSNPGRQSSYRAQRESDLKRYYKILNVTENATAAEIKTAYRKKVQEFHPDKIAAKGLPKEFEKFASEKFNEIQGAYEALKKRA